MTAPGPELDLLVRRGRGLWRLAGRLTPGTRGVVPLSTSDGRHVAIAIVERETGRLVLAAGVTRRRAGVSFVTPHALGAP